MSCGSLNDLAGLVFVRGIRLLRAICDSGVARLPLPAHYPLTTVDALLK